MTLAESILAGSVIVHPLSGFILKKDARADKTWGCALGMAAAANGIMAENQNNYFGDELRLWRRLQEIFPALEALVTMPCACYNHQSLTTARLAACITHLFDSHICPRSVNVVPDWTLEQLVDWVREQEAQFETAHASVAGVEVQEQEEQEKVLYEVSFS